MKPYDIMNLVKAIWGHHIDSRPNVNFPLICTNEYFKQKPKAPGHQYPLCWLCIDCIAPVSHKNATITANEIWNFTLEKISICLRINSLTPGGYNCNLELVIFQLISRIEIMSNSCKTAFRLMPQLIGDYPIIPSNYLSQCVLSFSSPYDATRL